MIPFFFFFQQETERESHSEREHIRSQIRELRGQQTQQSRELKRIGEKHSFSTKLHETALQSGGQLFLFVLSAWLL